MLEMLLYRQTPQPFKCGNLQGGSLRTIVHPRMCSQNAFFSVFCCLFFFFLPHELATFPAPAMQPEHASECAC